MTENNSVHLAGLDCLYCTIKGGDCIYSLPTDFVSLSNDRRRGQNKHLIFECWLHSFRMCPQAYHFCGTLGSSFVMQGKQGRCALEHGDLKVLLKHYQALILRETHAGWAG